ncbi:MAG TPA: carbamate kinase [Nitrososphaerales archaeon]|nr:carbamate kinase [Nitrososphaerales archaeon]
MKILVALGGNAILRPSEKGTEEEQLINLQATSDELAELVAQGHRISITHGNGPQVGDILLLYELARRRLPPMPLDVCGAQSQGMIGYLLQQSLDNSLHSRGLDVPTVTLLTRTIVDAHDPAMRAPSKPVGPFYAKKQANQLKEEKGWHVKKDSVRGYRRVVASPKPELVVEGDIIRELFDLGFIVIHSGGGGIPVVRKEDGALRGVEAVIDKDLTASLTASLLGVDVFLILTDVEKVFLNYGRQNQTALDTLTTRECLRYQREGQFAQGSMAPKIEAAREFVLSAKNRRAERRKRKAIITSLGSALDALNGKTGTLISDL